MEHIEITSRFTFVAIPMRDGEINGMVQDNEKGGIVEGSSGWYRTDDAMIAARVAAGNLASNKVISWEDFDKFNEQ